jgi:hypothetical protein
MALCSVATADELKPAAGYQHYLVGNPADVARPTSGLWVLQGGGDDVDENYIRMGADGGGGDFVVLRASQAGEYNQYIYDLCKCDSVETIVFDDRAAASDPFVIETIRNAEALTQAQRDKLTPDDIIAMMKRGNERFRSGKGSTQDVLAQQRASAKGQYPAAVILSCIDSRAPAETIMDLGIGDVFNARVAGNIANGDILGSMEFACAAAGAHRDRVAVAHRLGEGAQVRLHAKQLLHAALPDAETGLDFVDDQQDAVLVAQCARIAQKLVGRRDRAAVAHDRLDHEGGDVIAVGLEYGLEALGVVHRHRVHQGAQHVRDAGAARAVTVYSEI